jgi:hypothetical protein
MHLDHDLTMVTVRFTCTRCSERTYNHAIFYGRVSDFPIDDHNVPTMPMIRQFCEDAVRSSKMTSVLRAFVCVWCVCVFVCVCVCVCVAPHLMPCAHLPRAYTSTGTMATPRRGQCDCSPLQSGQRPNGVDDMLLAHTLTDLRHLTRGH